MRMEIGPVGPLSFELRDHRCPCFCGGEGTLAFVTCPRCSLVALVCTEVGTVFPNPRDLSEPSCGSWLGMAGSEEDRCPHCRKARLAEFRHSTEDEVRALGFAPNDYVYGPIQT